MDAKQLPIEKVSNEMQLFLAVSYYGSSRPYAIVIDDPKTYGGQYEALYSVRIPTRSTTDSKSEHTPTGDNENHWKRYDI